MDLRSEHEVSNADVEWTEDYVLAQQAEERELLDAAPSRPEESRLVTIAAVTTLVLSEIVWILALGYFLWKLVV